MAMEMHVFSDCRLTSIAEWQSAIDAEGYPLRLAEDVLFPEMNGFVPAILNAKPTGFECFHDDAKDILGFLEKPSVDRSWTYALGFRWRGDLTELLAASYAATAYAAATGGAVFDHQEGRLTIPEQARETVRAIERDIPRIEAALAEALKKLARRSEQ